jgi:hypothetical protein
MTAASFRVDIGEVSTALKIVLRVEGITWR